MKLFCGLTFDTLTMKIPIPIEQQTMYHDDAVDEVMHVCILYLVAGTHDTEEEQHDKTIL